MEDFALSLQDLYPVSVNSLTPGSTITAFVLEGTKLKTPEVVQKDLLSLRICALLITVITMLICD